MKPASNFATLSARVKAAQSKGELDRVEASATRVYNAGQLTVSEFTRIDVKIMEKGAQIGA